MTTEQTTHAPPRASTPRRRIADLPGPKALPLLGNGLALDTSRLHLVFEEWAREYGSIFRVMFGPRAVLVLADLALLQPLMQERPDTYRRTGTLETVLEELAIDGLFGAEGAAWKRQRKLLTPAFSMKQQRELFPDVARITENLRQFWLKAAASPTEVDARADLMRYTVDVTSHLVFGRDLNTLGGSHSDLQGHLNTIFHALNVRVNALVPYWRVFKLPRDRKVDRSLQHVRSFIADLIAQARRNLAADPTRADNPKNLLEAMIVAQDEESPAERFADREVSGNVLTLLLAGEDTTSNTLSWMLHYLAHEPEVQQRLHEEACAVLGDARVTARYEDVSKLKYAVAVTHETLRMRSPAPLMFFENNEDVEIGDIALPTGSWIVGLSRHLGVSEEHFSDAKRFNPERWLPGYDPSNTHNPRAALAFGAGPRTCPGRSLALFECAMVASMVARNFEVQAVSSRDEVEECFDFTMFPKGLKVRLRAR